MPGLFGIARHSPATTLAQDLERMVRAPQRDATVESLIASPGHAALARTHLGILQPAPQLHDGERVHVLLQGDVFNIRALARRCGLPEDTAPHRVIARLYEREAEPGLAAIEGAFAIAIVDTRHSRVLLLMDHVGSYPLYWTTFPHGFAFASSLSAVLRHPAVRRELDPAAVADYLTYGFPFGTKTLASGVSLAPAGSVVSYDWASDAVSTVRLGHISDAFAPWDGTRAEYIEALCSTFSDAVERSMSGPHAFGVSLSGGLDSRAILSALNGKGAGTSTYTLGVRGCADQVIAEKLARIAGTKHSFFELNEQYLREFLPNQRRMVSLTDGMYLSHGLTEILALDFIARGDFSVLVRGHGGELAKTDLAWPLHTDAAIRGMRSRDEFVPYLHRRANYISGSSDLRQLFTDTWAPGLSGGGLASLEDATRDVPLSPADLCSYLYLTEHHRRFTVPSIELFRNAVDVRLPFVDQAFLKVLFRGRPEWRADTSIHKALTAAGNRAMLRVRNSNTGAPASAGPAVEYALDKVNSLFKRLDIYGYRHYHTFDRWMREQLLSSVETVLLSRTSLDRGILSETAVRRVLDQTRAGQADHSYMLQVLLILELWQQENL